MGWDDIFTAIAIFAASVGFLLAAYLFAGLAGLRGKRRAATNGPTHSGEDIAAMNEGQVFDATIAEMRAGIARMEAAVPPPSMINTASGHPNYRYVEKLPQQALVLKCVRSLSALIAMRTLVDAGLSLDAGAAMRMLDELGSDIMFLAGPIVFRGEPEPRHNRFLAEFFQEEFDHPDPVKSTQSRDRVSRHDVRAYVARTYRGNMAVSDIVALTATIESTNSGYIHGAAVHTIDVYDGRRFCVPLSAGDRPLESVRFLLSTYMSRALGSFEIAAKALGDEELCSRIRGVGKALYNEFGEVRPLT